MVMSSIFVQTPFAVSKNSQQVTPWKTTRRIDIQVAGRDIPNQVPRNMKVNSFKLRNTKSFLTSIDSLGTVEKPFSKYRSLDEKHSNSAATIPEHEAAIIPEEEHPFSFQNSITKKFDLLQRFCRPLAIVGTAVGTSSIALLPLETISEISPRLIIGVLQVNKPYLPLVSGEMSLQTGAAIVAITSFIVCSISVPNS
ncbi:hypothetical protein IFM89_008493 [Coptis chinensis]|uniref:Uncharacterized protein n=1 Tax=Coptis chinensis TaxID=261450 RepID=A0A835H595_9MAGN|nr:hypothetical protein IFM89_008493 [Coptis chinensis]